ncbi:hypothetical protein [Conexibacter sp. W3-3-2]|uniref:hypothetical protein n=1 Tax=Conexibacter sp. W3-3-2 TaxID=2675227 RepID=UPI001E56D4A4|nr:hypothetical protein [Conexibacter sp. W3-3-2]
MPADLPGDVRDWASSLDFLGIDYFPGISDNDYNFDRIAKDIDEAKRRTGKPFYFTELGSPGGTTAQKTRIASAVRRFEGQVSGFWMWNRFAVKSKRDAERFTLGAPAIQYLKYHF